MPILHFKTNVYEYLETLPDFTFDRLFKKPATSLAIFRLLPSIARQIVMALLYIDNPIPTIDVQNWVFKEGQTKLQESLGKLAKLHIIEEKDAHLVMNGTFRDQFRCALTGGGDQQSFGLPCATPDKHRVDVAFLDQHANQQWEAILHYMVGTSMTKRPSTGVLKLLQCSELMKTSPGEQDLKITNKGFQFLLQDVNTQVWAFLLQYLDMTEVLQMDLVEVLNFLFQLGSLELGQDYSVDTLSPTQLQMLEDLRDFGIVYQRKKGSRRYYPTRLATTLTSGTTALTISGSDPSVSAGSKRRHGSVVGPGADDQENETGFVILETNYRLYAYTDSPLQIAVLNLFVHLKARFVNMVSGVITRDSVRKALSNGITADQIISYLQTHAHPQMRKKVPLLPLTVVDQIRLWEMERNRLKHVQGSLYEGFAMQVDFDATQKYAADIGALVWHNKKARMLFVTTAGKDKVSAYVKKLLARSKS